jgi:hypothetical protein
MEPMSYRACREATKTPETKMWACAHWCASPKSGTTQQFPITNIRRSMAKDKRTSGLRGDVKLLV